MDYVLRITGQKVGLFTLKVCGYVAGVGLTIIILRPVRKALYARMHGNSRNVYREKMAGKQRKLFSHLHELSKHIKGRQMNILYYGTSVLETHSMLPPCQITCITTNVHRKKDVTRLKKEHPEIQVYPATTLSRVSAMPDRSADAIVCCLVLCQVPDVSAALAEMYRALKPHGKLVFMEHTMAGKFSPTKKAQKRMAYWWGMLFYGCKLDRKVHKEIKAAGFTEPDYEKFTADVDLGVAGYVGDKLNRFLNWSFVYLIGPHVIGVATKPDL